MLERIIFERKDMTPEERILYAFLLNQRDLTKDLLNYEMIEKENAIEKNKIFTYQTNKELEELLGCSKSKLIKIKKSLEEKGILVQKRELGGKTKYFTFNKVGEV